MITTNDIQGLIQHDSHGLPVLSLFLDMSVNSENKRTHQVFLNKERARFSELDSDRPTQHREPLGALLARVETWIEEDFDPMNKGVAIFGDVGGDWLETLQFPAPVRNRFELHDQPVIGPLTEVVSTHPRCGMIIVDREHLRLMSLHMGVIGHDELSSPTVIDMPHGVQAGGWSHPNAQHRKEEEVRQFYRDFTDEVNQFDERVRPEYYVLFGTTENMQNFREYLAPQITDRIIHAANIAITTPTTEIVDATQKALDDLAERSEAAALNLVQDRVRQSHLATSGVHDTLVQLQEGKVERLVVARDLEKDGVQCTRCGFYLVQRDGACPYCGGQLKDGIDLVESMIRLAATQDVAVDFVAGDTMREMKGVAALLKFQ